MNKYNIEVGDKLGKDVVTLVDNKGISFSPDRYPEVGLYTWNYITDLVNQSKEWKLTKSENSKMNKKIIGYTLLKDSITVKKGGVYTYNNNLWSTLGKAGITKLPLHILEDTEWFSPIYEEVKPTEVYVDTLAGKVKVTKSSVNLEDTYTIPLAIKDFTKIVRAVKLFGNAQGVGEYEIKVNTFNVGCQLFSVDDISKIEEAIKQVS